ncbi:MAG: class I SAM-dependent methyltransferase [Phycisphaerales bacterium]
MSELNWYDEAEMYDIGFDWDVGPEVECLRRLFERWVPRPVRTVYEPFCGAGRLAVPLARAGFRVVGADLNRAMLELGEKKAAAAGVEMELLCADVCEYAPPCEAVVTLIDSFRHLPLADAARALKLWARACGAVGGQGVIVIGMGIAKDDADQAPLEDWEVSRGGVTVRTVVEMIPSANPEMEEMHATMHARYPDGSTREVSTRSPMARYTYERFESLVGACGLRVAQSLAWRYIAREEVDARSGSVVAVLVGA